MKMFKTLLVTAIFAISSSLFAQDKNEIKNEKIIVWGQCEMSQKIIVNAAKAAGASVAKWNVKDRTLLVTYKASEASMEKIEKAVAKAGYDTENENGDDEAYKSLPGCCQYDRKNANDGEEKKPEEKKPD